MKTQCFLVLTEHGYLRISGKQAYSFLQTMTTADMAVLAEIGGSIEALILSGQAEVIDRVTLIRTGEEEYMMITSPALHDEVFDWLKAHSTLADASGPIFTDVSLSDESEALSALTLFGNASTDILQELSEDTLLEAPRINDLRLARFDTVTALVYTPKRGDRSLSDAKDEYWLFCSPTQAEGLYNALLSFPEIEIITADEYLKSTQKNDAWTEAAKKEEYSYPDTLDLMHLVRLGYDFVGGKELSERLGDKSSSAQRLSEQ